MGLWDTITDWFGQQEIGLDPQRVEEFKNFVLPQITPEDQAAWDASQGQYAGMSAWEMLEQDLKRRMGPGYEAAPGYQPSGVPPQGAPLNIGGGPVQPPQPPPPGGEFGAPQQMPPGVGGQIPQIPYEGPESWQFPVPSTGEIDLNAVQRAQQVADIEAATADNWGRGPSGGPPPGPMEQYLSSYDERTNSIIEEMKRADQANKLLEMGAGVFDAGIGNYTGAMGNVFKTQASYNTKPGAYEAFRGERDSGKLDDLYKIAQTRKSMQGNQPQLGAKDQLALQFMENPEELRNYLGIGGEFAPVPFADGVGGYFYNKATGDFKLIGDENTYNINDERGMTMLNEAKNRALAMSDANLKRAEKSEQSRSAWETLVGFMGPEAASLLGSKPADQQRIMELALANVYAMQQIPMPEGVDVEMAWQTIMNDPEITDSDRQRIAEMVRRSVGQ